MAASKKTPFSAYEKADRAGDRKAGIKEGSKQDTRLDATPARGGKGGKSGKGK